MTPADWLLLIVITGVGIAGAAGTAILLLRRNHPTSANDPLKRLVAKELNGLTDAQYEAVEAWAWAHKDGWGAVEINRFPYLKEKLNP